MTLSRDSTDDEQDQGSGFERVWVCSRCGVGLRF